MGSNGIFSIGFTPLVNVDSLRTGKSPCFMGTSTISMAIFNSYVTNYQRVAWNIPYLSIFDGILNGKKKRGKLSK